MKLLHVLLSSSGEGIAVGLMNGAIIAIVLAVIYYIKDKKEKRKDLEFKNTMVKNIYTSIETEFDKVIIAFIKSDSYNTIQSKEIEIERIISKTSDTLKENFITPSRLISYYEIYSIIDEIATKTKRRYVE